MTVTSVSLDPETIEKADRIVQDRLVPAIKDRSALIEYALSRLFQELGVK